MNFLTDPTKAPSLGPGKLTSSRTLNASPITLAMHVLFRDVTVAEGVLDMDMVIGIENEVEGSLITELVLLLCLTC